MLRRAGAALNGRMVGVWVVEDAGSLKPLASNGTEAQAWEVTPEVRVAVSHLAMPAPPGSRWVAGRLADAQWCVAPVRDSVPDPPPIAQERRSRERLALELAGLCLGLSSRVAGNGMPADLDLFERFMEQLGSFAQDIGGPLAVARTAVVRSGAVLAEATPPDEAGRLRLIEDLKAAGRALEQAVSLVRTVHDRARAVLEHGGEFDVVQVVWSCVDAERPQAALRGASIELKTLAYVVSVPGSADSLRIAVSSMIRLAVRGLQGRVGTVTVSLENVGPVVRLTVAAPGAEIADGQSAVADARRVIESGFGGTLTISSVPGEGATITVSLPAPTHRFKDPALWWER
ncbi:MAG TPA: ATP-binding protein [Gemmatimonadales bacterium]|nr:ATP-binding protein [Gemmatimonadales bacterium]